jgi:4-diphosphocytidyl-2-C-methyl-D-erythritol kinase
MKAVRILERTNVQCPAKVNLFLEVTGKRKDGYHNLATLFAKISLFDMLEIRTAPPGSIELTVENAGPHVPLGSENIVVKAAEAFRKAFKVRCGAKILLKKNIPVGAGLGGGSSDAAGTLLGMERVFGLEGKQGVRPKLKKLAVGLGADVPFFLQDAPFCLGLGIGDKLRRLKVSKALPWMVLVYPRQAIATAKVYQGLGLQRPDVLTRLSQLGTLQNKLSGGRPISEWAGLIFNRLEEVVLPIHPEVQQAKRLLAQLGAKGVLMSGSGSSVFGFASSHTEGERIRSKLQGYPWQVVVTCCLG